MPSDVLVDVDHFRMDFGKVSVVRDLSFRIFRGETFGFLGSNGSGKTTTIRALLGIYRPTAGSLLINGRAFDPDNGERLGYLPEERGLYKKEPVIDVMVYFGRLKGLGRQAARRWSLDYLERVGLGDKEKTRMDRLSGGQQQKIQLGVTIMNDPELLILDEPTKGFDPVNRRLVMEVIDRSKAAGATVLMVTHQMEEVQRLCDRVILLKDGTARAYGTVPQVQEQFGGTGINVEHAGAIPPSPLYSVRADAPGVSRLSLEAGTDPAVILRSLLDAGVVVRGFTPTRKSLDDIFVEVYGSTDAREAGA